MRYIYRYYLRQEKQKNASNFRLMISVRNDNVYTPLRVQAVVNKVNTQDKALKETWCTLENNVQPTLTFYSFLPTA